MKNKDCSVPTAGHVQSSIVTLVLRTRSQFIGFALRTPKRRKNSKHEIRNPKQYRMTKIQITAMSARPLGTVLMVLFRTFDIRI
jgi:hypothetical protein